MDDDHDDHHRLISKWDHLSQKIDLALITAFQQLDNPVHPASVLQLNAANENTFSALRDIANLREWITKMTLTDAQLEDHRNTYVAQLPAPNAEKIPQIEGLMKPLNKLSQDNAIQQQSAAEDIGPMKAKNSERAERIARLDQDLDQVNASIQEEDKALEKADAHIEDVQRTCDSTVNAAEIQKDVRINEILADRDRKIVQLNDLNQANALVQERNKVLEPDNAEKKNIQHECDTRVNDARRRSDARIQELLAERDQAIAELETSRTKIRDEFQRKLVAKLGKFKERNDDSMQRAVEAVYESETTVVDLVRRQETELASKDEAIEALRHSQECALHRVGQLEVFNQRLNALLDKAIVADGHAKAWTNELKAIAKQETKKSCQLKSLLARQKEKNNQLQNALNESLRTNVRLGERLEDAGAEFHQASAARAEQHQKQLTQLQHEHDSLTALRDNELEEKIQSALAPHRQENEALLQRFMHLEQLVNARHPPNTTVLPSSRRGSDAESLAKVGSRSATPGVSPYVQDFTVEPTQPTEHSMQALGRAERRQVGLHRPRKPDRLPEHPPPEQSMLPSDRDGGALPDRSSPIKRRSSIGLLYGIHDHIAQDHADQEDPGRTLVDPINVVDLTDLPADEIESSWSDVETSPHVDETPLVPDRLASKRPAEDELASAPKLRRQTVVSRPVPRPVPTSVTTGQASSSTRPAQIPSDERVRRADHIWDLMHKDWSITSDQETKLREQLASLFSRGKAVDKVKEAIDKHVVGSFREKQVTPRPCLLANLTGENGGKGGSMTSGSCPYCKNKSHRVCVWAEYAPGVASGFGERNEAGVITDQAWDPTPSPSTCNIGGQQVRWYLKKRRDPVSRG